MAGRNNETTTKFNVDISQLKSQFSEAQRRVKLAVSEFNAATAGMKEWEKSADGLSAKLTQLNKTYEAESDKLKALEKQYELVVAEQGKNSKAAQELETRINNQKAKVTQTADAIQDYQRQLKEVQNQTTRSESALGKLTDKISEQEKELSDLKEKYKNVVLEQGNASDEAKELAGKITELSGNLNENRSALKEASDAADALDGSLEEVDEGAEKAKDAFDVMKVALGNLVAEGIKKAVSAFAEFTKQAIQFGMDFDSTMSKVEAISGATEEQLDSLKEKAKEMGAQTKFSSIDAAEAMTYMGMAGWKTEQMLDGIEGIMNLAAASGEELATTSDIVTDALTAFGMSAEDSAHFADVLAVSSTNANTNVSMMGETFKYVAPIAGTLGYSVDDVAMAIGLMANQGTKASDAGTSLRKGMLNLVSPTSTASSAMKELGFYTEEVIDTFDNAKIEKQAIANQQAMLTAERAQEKYNQAVEKYGEGAEETEDALMSLNIANEKLRISQEKLAALQSGTQTTIYGYNQAIQNEDGSMKSFAETAEFLRDKLGGLDKAEQAAAAAHIFGTNAVSGMLGIINASDEDFNKMTNAIKDSDGAAKDMAATMSDNLTGDVERFNASLDTLKNNLFDKLNPKLRELTQQLTEQLPVIEEKFYAVVESVKKTIKVIDKLSPLIVGLGTAIAGIALLGFIQNIGAIAVAMKTWALSTKLVTAAQWLLNAAMAANPIGLVIVAIAALVAAFVVLWNKSEAFRNFWINLWAKIKESTSAAVEWIKEKFEAIGNFFASLPEKFTSWWDSVKDFFENKIPELIGRVAGFFKALPDKIGDELKSLPGKMLGWLTGTVSKINEWGNNIKESGKKKAKEFVSGTLDSMKNGWSNLKEIMSAPFVKASESLKSTSSKLWDNIVSVFTEKIPGFIRNVGTWFEELPHNLGVALGKGLAHIVQFGIDLINFATEDIPAFISSVVEKIKELPEKISEITAKIVEFFKALPEEIWNWLKQTGEKISEFFTEAVRTSKEKSKEFIDTSVNFFKELPGKVWEWLKQTGIKISDFFKDAIKTGKAKSKEFVDNVISFFISLVTRISENLTGALEKIVQWGENIKETGSKKAKEFVEKTVEFFKELPSKIFGAISGAIDKIKEWGTNMVSTAKEVVENTKTAVVDGFMSLPEKIAEIGKNIVSGLWEGITGMGDWLKDKIGGFASGIVEGFTSELDIHSPSRVMEKTVGNNIVYGLVKGITDKTGDAVNSIKALTEKSISPLADIQSKINLSVSSNAVPVQSGNTTNNYYSFNQTNNSPKALSRLEIYRQTRNQINFSKGA